MHIDGATQHHVQHTAYQWRTRKRTGTQTRKSMSRWKSQTDVNIPKRAWAFSIYCCDTKHLLVKQKQHWICCSLLSSFFPSRCYVVFMSTQCMCCVELLNCVCGALSCLLTVCLRVCLLEYVLYVVYDAVETILLFCFLYFIAHWFVQKTFAGPQISTGARKKTRCLRYVGQIIVFLFRCFSFFRAATRTQGFGEP